MKFHRNSTAFMIFLLLVSKPVSGQVEQFEFFRGRTFTPGAHFKQWTFDQGGGDDKFTEIAFPLVYSVRLGKRLSFDVTAAPFLSKFEPALGSSREFNNVSDTFVRGSYVLGDNVALLSVGAGIPTGETDLTTDEFSLSGLAAIKPLDNPVTNFGTGPLYSVGLALAQEFGSVVVGVGAGYLLRSEYDVTLHGQNTQVDPGDELNFTVGVERGFEFGDRAGKFVADFIYTTYSKDEIPQQPDYESGDKIVVRGQLLLPIAIFDPIILSATSRTRSENSIEDNLRPELVDNGNEVQLRATFIQPAGRRFDLKYIVELSVYGDTESQVDGATIWGVGGGFDWKLSRHVSFNPAFIYSKGSINTGPNSDIDVTAIEASGGLAFRF